MIRIVIDLVGLDRLGREGGGLFRYAIDLIRALAELSPPAKFVVLGALPVPIPALQPVFTRHQERWEYYYFPRSVGRASAERDHIRIGLLLTRLRADLYHGLAGFAPLLSPCPVVATIHDLMYDIFPEYQAAARSRPYRLFRWAARLARRLICDSRATADDVNRIWHVPRQKMDVVHLGTTYGFEMHSSRSILGVPPGIPVVASPYNLEPRKNLSTLVTAFAKVVERWPSAKLLLFGRVAVTPEREQTFDRCAATASIERHLIRTGVLTDEQLAAVYRNADVFVFPSLYEGFGYPLLEAMAVGGCVIAREASAMSEVLGGAGLTVDTRDPTALAGAILRVLANPDVARRHRMLGQQRAAGFTLRRMAEGTFSSYEKALGTPRRG